MAFHCRSGFKIFLGFNILQFYFFGMTIAYFQIRIFLVTYVYGSVKNQTTIWILFGHAMMESLGKFLRKERETRNISLQEISKFTKIKEHHLKAIEEDKYDLLPPTPYVKGYLNVYAKYLTLDPKNIALRYEEYLKSLIPPEPVELQQQALHKKKSARPWYSLSFIFS